MRQSIVRGLDAMGLAICGPVRFPGVTGLAVRDANDNSWLICRPAGTVSNWPALQRQMQEGEYGCQLLKVSGQVMVAVLDTPTNRKRLEEFLSNSRQVGRKEVFLEQQGFVTTSIKKRLELKFLLGPFVALMLTLVGVNFLGREEPELNQKPIGCLTEISQSDLAKALADPENSNQLTRVGQVRFQNALAEVQVNVITRVGGVSLIDVGVTCANGDAVWTQYRYDLLNKGVPVKVELPD